MVSAIREVVGAAEAPPAVESAEGQRLAALMSSAGQEALKRWQGCWEPQENGYYCAPASALAALRFLGLGADLSQDSIYNGVVKPRGLFTSGVSFEHGGRLLQILGDGRLEVQFVQSRVEDEMEALLVEDLTAAFARGEVLCILANYWRPVTGGGHWSPLGGFAEGRVLVLDTQPKKAPPHWLPLRTMTQALCRHNDTTGLPRGYLVVWRRETVSGQATST